MADLVSNAVDRVLNITDWDDGSDSEGVLDFGAPLEDDEDIASRISAASIKALTETLSKEPVVLSKTIESFVSGEDDTSNGTLSNALHTLTEDVRTRLQEQYERSLLDMNRSVI